MNSPVEKRDSEFAATEPASGWVLFRDLAFFQLKLALDGLRDILLSPISIGAALWGAVSRHDNPGYFFYRLLELGHKSDAWINLFGAVDSQHRYYEQRFTDEYLRKIETMIKSEYEKGGLLKDVKERIDTLLAQAADELNGESKRREGE